MAPRAKTTSCVFFFVGWDTDDLVHSSENDGNRQKRHADLLTNIYFIISAISSNFKKIGQEQRTHTIGISYTYNLISLHPIIFPCPHSHWIPIALHGCIKYQWKIAQ